MFNGDLKKNSLAALEKSKDLHVATANDVEKKCTELHVLRHEVSTDLMAAVESFVNQLANSPKEFEKSYDVFKAETNSFCGLVNEINIESSNIEIAAGSSAVAGVAAGVGTAAFAPTAAMAIATTFGTASTGTAISTLSGAVATKTALAWLGGGALTAGGGGVAAGKALLALAGPIGWGIGGATLIGSGLYARSKNKKIAEEAQAHRLEIDASTLNLKNVGNWISRMISATQQHADGVSNFLFFLLKNAPKDYRLFDSEQKEHLGAMINHMNSLAKILNKKPE